MVFGVLAARAGVWAMAMGENHHPARVLIAPGQSHTPPLMDESISCYTKRVQTRFQSPTHSVNGSSNRFLPVTLVSCETRWKRRISPRPSWPSEWRRGLQRPCSGYGDPRLAAPSHYGA